MFLLNLCGLLSTKSMYTFTIQNVPIKYEDGLFILETIDSLQ